MRKYGRYLTSMNIYVQRTYMFSVSYFIIIYLLYYVNNITDMNLIHILPLIFLSTILDFDEDCYR